MNHIKLFESQLEYLANKDTLTKPFVVFDGTTVYFGYTAPVTSKLIRYYANAKLTETTTNLNAGLHTNAFNTTIESHEFSNGEGLITFAEDVTTVGNYAFLKTACTCIELPEGVTTIGTKAFYDCGELKKINIPSTVTSIASMALLKCYISELDNQCGMALGTFGLILVDVELEDGILIIDDSVVKCRPSATVVSISSDINSISETAFSSCTSLTTINYAGTTTKWNSMISDNDVDIPAGVSVVCLN